MCPKCPDNVRPGGNRRVPKTGWLCIVYFSMDTEEWDCCCVTPGPAVSPGIAAGGTTFFSSSSSDDKWQVGGKVQSSSIVGFYFEWGTLKEIDVFMWIWFRGTR